jgi:hypothetical protein
MNKNILTFATALLVGGSLLLTSCKKDETAPVISLKGDSVQVVQLTEAADPGATANDEKDGDISVINSDYSTAVNKNQVGTYTVKYTASDEAANEATKSRTVKVKAAYLAGNYSVSELGINPYNVEVKEDISIYNKLSITTFGAFTNAVVSCEVSGSTITIPSQTVTSIDLPTGSTISGSGSYDGASKKISTITYTVTYQGGSDTYTSTFTKL